MNEPHVHVGIMRRFHGLNGARTEITINLSGIPATASAELIDLMIGTADVAIDRLLEETEKRARSATSAPKPSIDLEVFGAPARPSPAPDTEPLQVRINQTVANLIGDQSTPVIDPETGEISSTAPAAEIPPEIAAEIGKVAMELAGQYSGSGGLAESEGEEEEIFDADLTEIPRGDEVRTGGIAFGIHVPYPPLDWMKEPLSTVGVDGGPGQLTAVNAAISSSGFGGKLRHPAILAILQAYGPFNDCPVPEEIGSVYDLSKAQAHVVLEWIEKTASKPEALRDLAIAVRIINAPKEAKSNV